MSSIWPFSADKLGSVSQRMQEITALTSRGWGFIKFFHTNLLLLIFLLSFRWLQPQGSDILPHPPRQSHTLWVLYKWTKRDVMSYLLNFPVAGPRLAVSPLCTQLKRFLAIPFHIEGRAMRALQIFLSYYSSIVLTWPFAPLSGQALHSSPSWRNTKKENPLPEPLWISLVLIISLSWADYVYCLKQPCCRDY